MMTDQFQQDETEQRTTEWWHRDHPTFTALAGFFTGMLFVTLVPGGFVGMLRLLFAYDTAEELFPLVLISLIVPVALLIAPRTRRFGVYMSSAWRSRRSWCSAWPRSSCTTSSGTTSERAAASSARGRPGGMIVGDVRQSFHRVRRHDRAAARLRRAPRSQEAAAPPRRPHCRRARRAGRLDGTARVPGQAAVDPLLLPAGRRPGRDDRPPGHAARRAGRRAAALADDAAAHARGRPGHHPQDAVAALRRRPRRVRADALPGPGHDVRLQPGRLRHGLPVLCDRPGRPPAQHVHRRDRRAGRRRRPLAGPRRGPGRTGPGLQRGVHGHGRAAGQLQGRDRRRTPADRPGARRARHVRARHHRLDRRAGAADAAAGRGGHPGHAGAVAARARRRAAQRAGADQHPLLGRRDRRGGLELRPHHQAPGLDRVRHDARHQRPGLARRPARRRAATRTATGAGCTST